MLLLRRKKDFIRKGIFGIIMHRSDIDERGMYLKKNFFITSSAKSNLIKI